MIGVEKKLKSKLYNFRVNEDEYKMIQYIKNKTNMDLPSSLREHIKKIYDQFINPMDDNVYRL